MVSLASASSSRAHSLKSSSSQLSLNNAPTDASAPVASGPASASSSNSSLSVNDDENVTITASRSPLRKGKEKSQDQDDLRLLAVSTHITELSYSISDIQTRIFEIQELRHKSQASQDAAGTTSTIDQQLMSLDERLESVSKGMQAVNEAVEPFMQTASTPTVSTNGEANESAVLVRKHAALAAEWRAVQDESETLREELKEDKWLTVFRTVTEQADGMMSSLEKAVNRCQDFIWQVHRRGTEDGSLSSSTASHRSDKANAPLTFETFTSLLDSFEAKKKHYMPATSKVLSIIDKGVQDRVTKNGETLRRHAESAQRWKNLRERIHRTDAEMENVRRIFLAPPGETTPSENGSNHSVTTSASKSAKNGYLATPPSGGRSPSAASTLSRSISPFRRFASKFTTVGKSSAKSPPASISSSSKSGASGTKTPVSEPRSLRHQRTSLFSRSGSQPPTPVTPDRPGHKYSNSLTPDSSPSTRRTESRTGVVGGTVKPIGPKWNSSTKVEQTDANATVKGMPPRRPSAMGFYAQGTDVPPVPPLGPMYRRSVSRSSMASSRPWSPVTSTSTTATSHPSVPGSSTRPPSRMTRPASRIARPPSRAQTPSSVTPPKPRPKTPSHIPTPSRSHFGGSDAGHDDEPPTSLMQRVASPAFSASAASAVSGGSPGSRIPPPRPPSRSMIPVPSFQISPSSRPGTAMSSYSESPSAAGTSSFRSSAMRAQTPESALKAKIQQLPLYQAAARTMTPRPSLGNKVPPSSFRDASRTPAGSRPGSRAGAYTPGFESNGEPVHQYVPGNPKDPLDAEVAAIVNSIAHGLLVERVDAPLKKIPKEGEEIRAQYAFSNALSRKVVTCRLTTLVRSGAKAGANGHDVKSKKVMCRVGGGWQDLELYMLNRAAGM